MTITDTQTWTGPLAPPVTDLDPQPRMQRAGGPPPRGAVLVSAGTAFGNPFYKPSMSDDERVGATIKYAVTVAAQPDRLAEITAIGGRDLACTCTLGDPGCHRDVLLDLANPARNPYEAQGRAMGLTLRRPWASLLLVPETLSGKTIENRTWSTDYRGPVLIYGGTRVDNAGVAAAERVGLDAHWHINQQGWLGAAALVDVHRARGCCRPWGQPGGRDDVAVYHWVFAHPHRLSARTWGRGFVGIRPTSWSVLVRRSLLNVRSEKTRGSAGPSW
ncbi:DUF4326 domain-containing protein [Mycobacterium intracellulare]|jgi:hypothetical protein|uniref:DUF4326 domain-containing protein n=1 Tax=Mycobacterium intracellulare TaxID=1767 RepID=UPI001140C5FB|nr:DUF4326 domain-containing protein [Mycobacterium intracellulare]